MIKAMVDPKFIGMKSFELYTKIESHNAIYHMIDVVEHITKNRPEGDIGEYECMIYSMPDAIGMRFMREYADGHWMSDFRHEWYRSIVQ